VSCAGRRNSGIIVETWHSGTAPTSSRWLDAEWIAEVLAPRASGEVHDGTLGDAALCGSRCRSRIYATASVDPPRRCRLEEL
jgi:hypothetical protein